MKIIKEPIYQQLITILRKLIQSDKYEIGDKFLTENEIRTLYDISRNTVNKAVTSLIGEGLLEFRKGVGTFIKYKNSQYDLYSLISFTKMAEDMGKIPSTRVLEFKVVSSAEVDKSVRTSMQIETEKDLYYIKRLRLLNGEPSILETRYVDTELSPDLTEDDVSGSILSMWVDKYDLHPAATDQTLRAISLTEQDARILHGKKGDSSIQRESTGYLENGAPLWFERTIFCGKDYVFRFRLDSSSMNRSAKSVFIGDLDEK